MIKAAFIPEPLKSFHKLCYMDIEDVTGRAIMPDVVFNWNYSGVEWDDYSWHPDYKIINEKCLCTKKSYIDKIFNQVYGYSSEYKGKSWCVEKNDHTNGHKDAVLVRVDENREEGKFYQLPFFDTRKKETEFTEFRIVVMGYKPVMTVKKNKILSAGNLIGHITSYEFHECPDLKVEQYCRAYPLEYGEIDSCFWDDRFYMFDVNPTPGDAMFHRMPEGQAKEFKALYRVHFNRWMEELCS
jgi:hypothetical protein